MKKYIILLVIWSIAKSASSQVPAKGIFVMPSIVEFNLANNQIGTKTLNIQNRTENTVQLKVYLADWERDSMGKHKYLNPGSISTSCSEWLKFDKEFIEIASGASTPLNVTLKVPDSATSVKEMKWSMLFIEVVNEKKAVQDTGVSTSVLPIFRMGVHVYQTPPTLTRKEIKMLSFDPLIESKDSIVYSIFCENVGDVHVKAKSSLELTNLTDGTKIKLGPDPISIFPGARRRVNYRLPATLVKGKYSLLAVIEGSEDMPIEAAQTEIEIK